MTFHDREALSVDEAAKAANVSRATLYQFISSGELPSLKIGDRRLIRRQALQAWLAKLEQHTASNDDVHQRDRAKAVKARSHRGRAA